MYFGEHGYYDNFCKDLFLIFHHSLTVPQTSMQMSTITRFPPLGHVTQTFAHDGGAYRDYAEWNLRIRGSDRGAQEPPDGRLSDARERFEASVVWSPPGDHIPPFKHKWQVSVDTAESRDRLHTDTCTHELLIPQPSNNMSFYAFYG